MKTSTELEQFRLSLVTNLIDTNFIWFSTPLQRENQIKKILIWQKSIDINSIKRVEKKSKKPGFDAKKDSNRGIQKSYFHYSPLRILSNDLVDFEWVTWQEIHKGVYFHETNIWQLTKSGKCSLHSFTHSLSVHFQFTLFLQRQSPGTSD